MEVVAIAAFVGMTGLFVIVPSLLRKKESKSE